MNGERGKSLSPHLQSAKIAFGELVDTYGDQAAAAQETGKGQSRICAYISRNMPDFAPLDVIDCLEDRTVGKDGWPHVTSWLARRRGAELVFPPDPSAPPMPITALLSDLARAQGQLSGGVLNDVKNGAIDPVDAWRHLAEADELVRVAVNIRAALKATADQGGA
jgi:hypothetical protein